MGNINKVIMICVDTLRADTLFNREDFYLKYNIKQKLNTPNLDWLVRESTLLKNCITTSPYTTASHASYFTGYWPKHHSVMDFFKNKLSKPTIYNLLNKKGYKTFFCNDFPFILGDYLGFKEGADRYYIESELECLKDFHNTDGNKFAFFHFADVHWPYGYHKLKSNNEFDSLENFLMEQSKITGVPLSKKIKPGPIEAIKEDKELLLEQNYRMIIDYYCNKKDYNTVMQWYADGISRFDNSRFDEFIKSLKDYGLFDDPNTLIVIFGDHGENWSDESYGHFNSCDYSVINVPVLLHSKSIPRKIINEITRTIDIVPSIINFLNVDIKNDFDGVDLYSKAPDYSVTQSWVSDFKELVGFFQETKNKNKFIDGKIKSFLLKEAVIKDNKKLEFKYTNSGEVEYSKSSIIKNGLEINTDLNFQEELGEYLRRYNHDLVNRSDQNVAIEDKILNEFKNLGYYGGEQ